MRSKQRRNDLFGFSIWRLLLAIWVLVSFLFTELQRRMLIHDRSGGASAFCGTGCQSGFGKCDPAPVPGDICGVEGFANKAEYYASSFNLIPTADVSTCATLCLAEATCMSYLFNTDLQNCAYLTWSLSQGEFIATTGTNQLFWDRACAETTAA